ncbi:magnesium/cobalt transporter CorA [Sphingobium sufflavum]|uniref:magnesium/cobalt transporter CorA n=1 Tax=Sphingobium sufflavum TaxID=1129547 RepID=UPI001F36394A|nr:magnesium/cobalt transporter CorA [Sphingobium sufflavum]MCE7797979.1 magnesium/cobalt transporter CorA [Sphingobium sufflavum]
MTIIAAVHYEEGAPAARIDITDGTAPATGFDWIGLFQPSAEEMAAVARRYGLHPLAVEDAVNGRQMPKLESYGQQLFLIARTASLVDGNGHIDYGETAIFLGRSFIITVRHGSARSHTRLREQLETSPNLLGHGPDYVLHAILDYIVDGYFPIVNTIEEDVLAMEDRLLEGYLQREDVVSLFTLRHDVVRFQRVLGPMQEVARRLVNLEFPCIDQNTMPYFRDVLDHVLRAEYRVTGLREVLSSAIETSNLVEQQRQGEITRQLAAWAAILAVPTAIAGIYGMNFDIMPELRWKYGYFAVIGLMAVVCGTLYRRFKKSGWL